MPEIEIGVGAASAPKRDEITAQARAFDEKVTGLPDREQILEYLGEKKDHLGPASGVDPQNLSSSGWGVLFAADEKQAVIDALRPLLDWRKSQAGDLYREYKGETGYVKQTKSEFLKDAGGFGPVNPQLNGIPYYLLFVGSPEQIPYKFQYLVDVQYAVGRIHFDTPAEYRLYAENVVAAEKQKLTMRRKAGFYGTANKNDSPTQDSRTELIEPLAEQVTAVSKKLEAETGKHWDVDCPAVAQITKKDLVELVTNPPALAMLATHGAEFPASDPKNQRRYNGSLLSQDHVFPKGDEKKPIQIESFLTPDDVPPNARLHGSIFLLFACFGGGTPKFEDFVEAGEKRRQLSEAAFLAALPKRLLTGGTLAVIAHVERAWTTSFKTKAGKSQLQTFLDTWTQLLKGYPVGFAMEAFNLKWAELTTELTTAIVDDGNTPNQAADSPRLRSVWEAMHDARNFCVIGDPAVRAMVGDVDNRPVEIERNPVIESTEPDPAPATSAPEIAEKTPEAFGGIQTLFSGGNEAAKSEGLSGTLESIVGRIGATMEAVVNGLTTVEVTTYVSDNVAGVEFKDGTFVGAKMRARTRLGMDGKTVNLVPEKDGKLDEVLWGVHMASVDKAVANRSEMIKLAATAAGTLLGAIKGK